MDAGGVVDELVYFFGVEAVSDSEGDCDGE